MNAPVSGYLPPLSACLIRLAQLQHDVVDRLALREAAEAVQASGDAAPRARLAIVTRHLQVADAHWLKALDPAVTPALLFRPDGECGILRGKNGQDQWVSEWWDALENRWSEQADAALPGHHAASLKLAQPYSANASPLFQLIRREIFSHKATIREVILCGLMINVVALIASFYSMQVYDRVIPTAAAQTLMVLTVGVLAVALFELAARRVRSRLYDELVDQVDQRLARMVYLRFLAVRRDQLPHSVGSLASQMRGYETVRGFFTSTTTNLLVDAPFALVFMLVIFSIGGPIALVPLVFFLLSLGIGLYYHGQVEEHARNAAAASNRKAGLLVETVEGAETIKSGQGGWRMLARWMHTTDSARDSELAMRSISEHSQHLTALFQQCSYVLLVASGALMVSHGSLTMGGLIACSILAGRVLGPVSMIPSQLMQWAHTKAALQGLDRLWKLESDHQDQEPVVIERLRGHYRFDAVSFQYQGQQALSVPSLTIAPGEKVGVLGPVGAGKTTLLRLLSGMYKPHAGRILLDDVDLAQIAKPALAEHVGYVQQDGRLFAGTLRDNLILGLLDPGDEAILAAARQTGLLASVIARHPKGLGQDIHEGGSGLSGGQRQLVNLTRAFLRQPRIWLLDEPTASMDRNLEAHVTDALRGALSPSTTLVLVTHKADMLDLVDRLIVVADHKIVLDGPKNEVLRALQPTAIRQEQAA
jgi:ATP-binding cassette subfamily C protein LapB